MFSVHYFKQESVSAFSAELLISIDRAALHCIEQGCSAKVHYHYVLQIYYSWVHCPVHCPHYSAFYVHPSTALHWTGQSYTITMYYMLYLSALSSASHSFTVHSMFILPLHCIALHCIEQGCSAKLYFHHIWVHCPMHRPHYSALHVYPSIALNILPLYCIEQGCSVL